MNANADSFDEVRSLRKQADDYARKNDMLAAALCDTRASQMVERLRANETK